MADISRTDDADIAITGSTGRVGGLVARALADAGVSQRLLVRDPSRAPQLAGATVVQASYDDGDAVRRALDGVRVAFMVSAAESQNRLEQHRTFVDAAAAAGVDHLVYLSIQGATPQSTFTLARDHAATESHIVATGMAHTFLRDNFYADFTLEIVGPDGAIRGPGGEGRAAYVAIADVAASAAAVLHDADRHRDASYTLTGPTALTFAEVAEILTDVTGRQVSYVEETIDEAYASRASYDAPSWMVDAWVSTYTAIAAGEFAEVTGDVELLTGRPATDLATVVRARASS